MRIYASPHLERFVRIRGESNALQRIDVLQVSFHPLASSPLLQNDVSQEKVVPSMLRRVIVTGSSGYVGCRLVGHFQEMGAAVMGVDVRQPRMVVPDQFVQSDICNPKLAESFKSFEPDTVIHAAFVVNPIHDDGLMRRINVEGTRNVLAAVEPLSPQRFMLFSSATAYGAWKDNPVPMDETWPIRARADFRYSADKVEVERLVEEYSMRDPTVAVSCVRPAVVAGPGMDNYLRKNIFGMPFLVRFERREVAVQFVHEDDMVDAIATILAANGKGPYNVAPPDWTFTSVLASETNRRLVTVPFWLAERAARLVWKTRLPFFHTPPGYLHFARYPWVVSPKRLCSELGFQFRFSSVDTIRETVRAMRTEKPRRAA